MSKVLKDYTDETAAILADGSKIISPDRYPVLVAKAVELYSNKIPVEVTVDLISDGSGDFKISDLAGFDEELSGDVTIESPIAAAGAQPNIIDRRDWGYYRKPAPDGKVIRSTALAPAGQAVRFTYKTKHLVTDAASTIVDSHFYAVCQLAAAEGCVDLSLYYTQTGEGSEATLGGQSFFITKAKEYETRASNLRKKAYEVIGAGAVDAGPAAASVNKNWDQADSRGQDRLTHKRRYR